MKRWKYIIRNEEVEGEKNIRGIVCKKLYIVAEERVEKKSAILNRIRLRDI